MSDEEFLSRIDRRTFLRIVSITGAAGLIYPQHLLSGAAPLDLSRVVIIEDSSATSGLDIDPDVAQSMVNCGIMNLTQIFNLGEAWKSLFPDITESSVVSIKVGCLNSSLSTHPEVAYAVANSLQEMDFDGTPFPANNIIIYDRWDSDLIAAGYTINGSDVGVRCYGTDSAYGGYTATTFTVYNSTQRLSLILRQQSNYVVNISALKNHTIAGVTLCLKNHYGTCNRPDLMHGGNCNPYIPALNALTPVLNKNAVNICDAMFGIATGGPLGSPQFAPNSLLMSKDIVALDFQGREMLAAYGCNTISISGHVDTAAGDPYNLGTNDPEQMDVVTLSEPAGVDDAYGASGIMLQQNHPNPFTSDTRIRFYLPESQPVSLSVYDANGRRVRGLVENEVGSGWHDIAWDGMNDRGARAAGGVYFCQLRANGYEKAVIMQMVR
ncbi:MAG: DUF362 domain-containing protein [bacterium]|jgi:uncharacterized protein (DUF362 family)